MARPNRIFLLTLAAVAGTFSPTACVYAVPLGITKVQDFAFGRFIGGGGSVGTVTISTAGVRGATGGVVLLPGAFNAANFRITGNAGATYTLSIPASYTITSGSIQMTVNALTTSIATSGVLPAGGTLTFTVGGTLTVGPSQVTGPYTGTLSITYGK